MIERLFSPQASPSPTPCAPPTPGVPPWCEVAAAHPMYPSASAAVAIRYDDSFGRHVVAVRDVAAGETLFAEDPLVAVLHPSNEDAADGAKREGSDTEMTVVPSTLTFETEK